ncbi:hypothetical protein EIP91_011466 [Steccherinum ochraceum]|uniref:Uncharacterized protein n=1 Tax=Steccherinum ochraceum TaxID=92696 RepID=A0A4R0R7H3_9APHY|nr:hypothetical protein EIP91_011466 [Steccherinum ochraceum]
MRSTQDLRPLIATTLDYPTPCDRPVQRHPPPPPSSGAARSPQRARCRVAQLSSSAHLRTHLASYSPTNVNRDTMALMSAPHPPATSPSSQFSFATVIVVPFRIDGSPLPSPLPSPRSLIQHHQGRTTVRTQL